MASFEKGGRIRVLETKATVMSPINKKSNKIWDFGIVFRPGTCLCKTVIETFQ